MHHQYKRAQTKTNSLAKADTLAKTHPWDGDIEDTRNRLIWFSLLVAALLIILFQTSNAQKVIFIPEPDIAETEPVEPVERLTRSELRAAEDYQEIIAKLGFLIRHHIEYFSDYNKFEGRKYQNLLLKTLINIEKGNFCADVDRLTTDLSKLTTSLKKEEKSLKKDKSQRKLYKNVRTLRSDLEMVEEILEEEIADKFDDHKSSLKEIRIFLQQEHEFAKQKEEYQIAMYELQEQLQENLSDFLEMREELRITFDEDQMRELFEAKELQKELEKILELVFTIELPEKTITIKIPTDSIGKEIRVPKIVIPDVPAPPVAPDITKDLKTLYKDYNYNAADGKAMLSNQYKDSMLVKSSKIPIFIHNTIGDIDVLGWDRNKIVAVYNYEVISDTYEDTKDFLESITLEMTSDKSGIHIASDFPNLHNTKRQVVHSSMILYIPKKNELDITNSFGRTEVVNFKNDLSLKTKNSDMVIENINGNVVSKSKRGSSYFDRINGNIQISSNRGSVTVENSNSSINISNSYAPILLSDCLGDATITNSGEIEIYNHTGNVDIQNENGQTTVESLTGDLTLTGSFKPFIISSIDGSVDIENKNAVITLSDISGESIVMNQSGLIKAHSMQGPIEFSNYGGEIYFLANNSLKGNSEIRSDYGMINIVLPEESNIILEASTEGGSILNSYQTKIVKDDFLSSTTIALGKKSKKLEVTGTNATIIIKDSK